MTGSRRRWLSVGAWLLATALLLVLARQVDAALLARSLMAAHWHWLAIAILANALMIPLGGLQWRALLPIAARIRRRRVISIFAVTSVANNTTPAIIGHATGVVLLAAEPTVGEASALSVLALDQLAVGLAKISVLVAATALFPLPVWMRTGLFGLAGGVAVLLVAVTVAAHQHERIERWNAGSTGHPWLRRCLDLFSRWTRDLESIRVWRRFAAGLGYALATKGAEGAGIVAVQLAFGLVPTAGSVFVVLAATSLSSLVPVAPANVGPFEAATFAAYRALGVPADAALGIALVQHVCLLVPAVVPGYAVLTLRRGVRAEKSYT